MKRRTTTPAPLRPCAVGSGLLALDVVVNVGSAEAPRCYSGGTCGNVLTILSYRGWHAAPVSRLAPGPAAERLLADLTDWKVSTEFISVQDGGSTPVIIERIARTAGGEPHHTFSWRCPGCGTHLPGYKPVLATVAEALTDKLPTAQVFFFDRVSRGVLRLAEASSKGGAVVAFEPSGVGDPDLFREAWSLAHVVKYSHERLRDIADLDLKRSEREGVLLEVETLGPGGLRYHSRLPKVKTSGWRELGAFTSKVFKDAAGSGDWCTAGILHRLARGGLRGLRATNAERLENALRYGQALACWNCGFEGARGGMYQVSRPTFERQVQKILQGGEVVPALPDEELAVAAKLLGCFCPACKGTDLRSVTRSANGARAE
jgi:sugar/nucleoside kinase (ribokinase family)